MNKVILIGRLVADPEFKRTTSGVACCRFRLAVNRPYRKDAENQQSDFINCVSWRQTAEFICRYFAKGHKIVVEGRLQSNAYEDNEGKTHRYLDVLADTVEFGESKNSKGQTTAQEEPHSTAAQSVTEQTATVSHLDIGEFDEILSDGEVPF